MFQVSILPVSITKVLLPFYSRSFSKCLKKPDGLVRHPGAVIKFGIKFRNQQLELKRLVTSLQLISKDRNKSPNQGLEDRDSEADKAKVAKRFSRSISSAGFIYFSMTNPTQYPQEGFNHWPPKYCIFQHWFWGLSAIMVTAPWLYNYCALLLGGPHSFPGQCCFH